MTQEEFDFLKAMLKERSGLMLSDDKRYLIESRLGPVATQAGLANVSALVAALRRPTGDSLRFKVTEAMTINESFFFRDKMPFDAFRDVMLPRLVQARASQKRLRVWSAAASTGQEAYSLAILCRELDYKLAGFRVEILGTDLSSEVLEKARAGLYSQFEVQRGMPSQWLVKYFRQAGSMWQVDSALKAMVEFRHFNLLTSFAGLGTFDVVFCRNVLIYFDQPTKTDVLNRIAKQMAPDGFLVLGAAETMVGLDTAFDPVSGHRGLYQPRSAAHARPAAGLGFGKAI